MHAYLGDLVIRAPPWLVGEVVPRAARILAPMGGRLNERKCQAWSPSGAPPPGLPDGFWKEEGLLLLGTPHGEGPDRGQDAPLPLGSSAVHGHLGKVLLQYEEFVLGLEQVVRDAPPGSPRV